MRLKYLYQMPGKVVVTAHRGFSSRYPENTLTAFRKAIEVGVDIVEFDVRETRDGQLVILHDATLDRTTNGTGPVTEKTWTEIENLNATYWAGPHNSGQRLTEPASDETIPLLATALELLAGQVGLNIQVYTQSQKALEQLIDLYHYHQLQESAYLMVSNFEQGKWVREYSPGVALCVGEERSNIERHLAFGVDFMQPQKALMTDEYLHAIEASGVPYNVFYANVEADMQELLKRGVRGIMTDAPDLLCRLRSALGTSSV